MRLTNINREVILKKKKNAILKSQIDQYEKVLEDVSKEKDGQNSGLQDLEERNDDEEEYYENQHDFDKTYIIFVLEYFLTHCIDEVN